MKDFLDTDQSTPSYDGGRFTSAVERAYSNFLDRTKYGRELREKQVEAIETNRREMLAMADTIPDQNEDMGMSPLLKPVMGGGGESPSPTPEFSESGEPLEVDIKLANYGYDDDTSPDYNSNVLRIGHANNKLEDGKSAAITKSLANRLGLKTGDWVKVDTTQGEMVVRYDDTVPSTYKGKPLPETVDIYRRNGSNDWGGKVKSISLLKPKS